MLVILYICSLGNNPHFANTFTVKIRPIIGRETSFINLPNISNFLHISHCEWTKTDYRWCNVQIMYLTKALGYTFSSWWKIHSWCTEPEANVHHNFDTLHNDIVLKCYQKLEAILAITFFSVKVIWKRKTRYPFKYWTMAICLWKSPQIFPYHYFIFCTCCIKQIFVVVEINHNKL